MKCTTELVENGLILRCFEPSGNDRYHKIKRDTVASGHFCRPSLRRLITHEKTTTPDAHTPPAPTAYLQVGERPLPLADLRLERLDEGRAAHRLGLHQVVVQHQLNLVQRGQDRRPGLSADDGAVHGKTSENRRTSGTGVAGEGSRMEQGTKIRAR